MESLRIEILNPKALKLLIGMQDLDLIRMAPVLKKYLKKTKQDIEPIVIDEETLWKDLSAQMFLNGYGEHEPKYTESDIKEPNFEYKGWKEK